MITENFIASSVNGTEVDSVSLFDRGLNFGDGVFETMAYKYNQLCFWTKHWERLISGCDKLNINQPEERDVKNNILKLLAGQDDCTVKLIVTRGCTPRGYVYPDGLTPNYIILVFKTVPSNSTYAESGVNVIYCKTPISENPVLAGIKHLNRLEQVLARNEWGNDSIQEGLMQNAHGDIIEGTMSNIFIVKNDSLYTPELSLSGIRGVIRAVILEIADKTGINIIETAITKEFMLEADEIFLTNSLIEIWPVKKLESKEYKIGRMTKLFQSEVKKTYTDE